MLAVISPSKTQDFCASAFKKHTLPRQTNYTQQLVDILKLKNKDEIAELMSISDKLADLNYQRFQDFALPFDLTNAKQALLAFKGDVYHGVDAPSLSVDDLDFSQECLRMLSGLYGVIRPLDLIAPYRLEMGTKLATVKGNNLYKFWGDKIAQILNQDESETLINLASNEYFKGIDQQALNAKIINLVFKENRNGVYKVIGIYAKRARGLMVRFMIDNRIKNPQDLQQFDAEEYRFNADMSTDNTWVFIRG